MEDAQQRSIRKPPPRTRSSRRPGKATRKRDRTARVNDFSIPPGKRHKIPVPASEENPGVKPGCRDRPRSFCVRMLFPDAFTTPPEARPPTPPAPAGHNTPHRPSSAPPGSGRPPFPPGRCHTARSPPAPAQTPGGRAPRGAAAPSPPAVSPSEDSRSRGTPPPADMTGSVLCHREGDVIIRVDRRVTAVAVDEQNPRLSTRNPRAGDRALPPGGPPGEQGGAPRDRGCDIRAAHEKKPFPVTPEQGLANVRVCEAIYRSLAA